MPRRNFGDGQEAVLADLNGINQATERGLYDRVIRELVHQTDDAFFKDGLKVNFSAATQVTVLAGLGIQYDASQSSPEPTRRPIYLGSNAVINLTTPDGSNDRIDIIVAKADIVDEISDTRKYKAPGGAISNQTFVVQKDWEADVYSVAGTPAGSPSAPSVPAGYIKLAECYIHAVTGMASQSDITDSRTLMPIGEDLAINTTGFSRLTAGAAESLASLLYEIDAYIKNGYFEYFDVDDLGTDPDAPANGSGKARLYMKNGTLYWRDELPGGAITPIGSGGGGGGGLVWTSPDGEAPVASEEYGQDVFLFESGSGQKLRVFVKVPESYLAGRQINMIIGQYSPSAANTQLLQANAALIRKDVDPIDTPFKDRDSTNSAITNTVAKQYRRVVLDLTDAVGQIDGAAVAAGDMIEVELSRGTDTDTADIRFIPTSTELQIG